MLRDLAVLVALFVLVTLAGEALGTPNTGWSFSFAAIAFVSGAVFLMLRPQRSA